MSGECDKDTLSRIAVLENLLHVLEEHLKDRMDSGFLSGEKAVSTAMTAQEKAIAAALVAQEKQTSSAFASSEKAVMKAEEAQKEYNLRSNEFRGQLDDQAKRLMPRVECEGRLKTLDSSVVALQIFQSNLMGKMAIIASIGGVIGAVVMAIIAKWIGVAP